MINPETLEFPIRLFCLQLWQPLFLFDIFIRGGKSHSQSGRDDHKFMKKLNAFLSVFLSIVLVLHVLYTLVSYLIFYYNPMLSMIFGNLVLWVMVAHMLCSIVNVLWLHDSKSISYLALNRQTLIQRISAVVMVLTLLPHINSFKLFKLAGAGGFWLIEGIQLLFFAAVFSHISVSFSRAFISLGLLGDNRIRRRLDKAVTIVCAILFLAAAVITTRVNLILHT